MGLIYGIMKCDACGKEFKGIEQHSQYYCNRCNKHFTLCPDCRKSWVCDYCGSNDLLDHYPNEQSEGTDQYDEDDIPIVPGFDHDELRKFVSEIAANTQKQIDIESNMTIGELADFTEKCVSSRNLEYEGLAKKKQKVVIEDSKSCQNYPCTQTVQNTTTQQSYIDPLKNNPIFQLSLSSKELFHSNFLCWLAEDPNTGDVFKYVLELFGYNSNEAKGISDGLRDGQYMALREYKNFDFCICEKVKNPFNTEDEFVPGRIILLLENKFKSIPYEAQLRKYQNLSVKVNKDGINTLAKAAYVKNHNDEIPSDWRSVSWSKGKKGICTINPRYVLLSLADKYIPLSINNKSINVDNTTWHVVSYLEYAQCLYKNQGSNNSFESQLISLYSTFITSFYHLLNLPQNVVAEPWSILSDRGDLRSIRIDDIWQKLIANIICAEIAKSFPVAERDLSAKELVKKKIGTVCINAGFSRGTAIIEVKKVVADDELHGIQIQNNQYRYLVEKPGLTTSESDIKNFVTNNGFTPTSSICGFGKDFKYMYKKITTNEYIGDIIKEVVDEIRCHKYVLSNKSGK